MRLIHLFLILLCLLPIVNAWTEGTHQTFAKEICYKFEQCVSNDCFSRVIEGSTYPKDVLRDTENTKLYRDGCFKNNDAIWCETKDCDDCTTGSGYLDKSSLERESTYLVRVTKNASCEDFFNIAVASYYFLESKEFWNQVKGEKTMCVINFEDDTTREFSHNVFGDWLASSCSIEVSNSDFKEWFDEFLVEVSSALDETYTQLPPTVVASQETQQMEQQSQPQLECVFNKWRYTTWLCTSSRSVSDFADKKGIEPTSIFIALVIILLVYIIFLRAGRRRK